jgi:hypothetical protein
LENEVRFFNEDLQDLLGEMPKSRFLDAFYKTKTLFYYENKRAFLIKKVEYRSGEPSML